MIEATGWILKLARNIIQPPEPDVDQLDLLRHQIDPSRVYLRWSDLLDTGCELGVRSLHLRASFQKQRFATETTECVAELEIRYLGVGGVKR